MDDRATVRCAAATYDWHLDPYDSSTLQHPVIASPSCEPYIGFAMVKESILEAHPDWRFVIVIADYAGNTVLCHVLVLDHTALSIVGVHQQLAAMTRTVF